MKKAVKIIMVALFIISLPFLLSDNFGRTGLIFVIVILIAIAITTVIASKKKTINTWIGTKTEGQEKKWAVAMVAVSFVIFGISVYNKQNKPENDKMTISNIIDEVKSSSPENTIGIQDAYNNFREEEKTEKALEIVNRLQVEFEKDPLDTVKIKELQAQLKALDIVIPLK